MPGTGGPGFEEFVDAELPKLFALGYSLSGDEHDAWEHTQEALVRVGLKWSCVDRERDPGAYARVALVRVHLNHLRWHRHSVLVAAPPEVVGPDVSGDLAAALELRRRMAEALVTLSPRQRVVIVLRYVEDLALPDIAEAMGCSVGTVETLHARAVERLREATTADLPPVKARSKEGAADAGS